MYFPQWDSSRLLVCCRPCLTVPKTFKIFCVAIIPRSNYKMTVLYLGKSECKQSKLLNTAESASINTISASLLKRYCIKVLRKISIKLSPVMVSTYCMMGSWRKSVLCYNCMLLHIMSTISVVHIIWYTNLHRYSTVSFVIAANRANFDTNPIVWKCDNLASFSTPPSSYTSSDNVWQWCQWQ